MTTGRIIPEHDSCVSYFSKYKEPFCMYYSTIAVHSNFERPKTLTPKQRKQWNYKRFISNFAATLHSLDDNVGRLLKFLHDSGLSDNTIVIFTSDHGFFLGEHGWFDRKYDPDEMNSLFQFGGYKLDPNYKDVVSGLEEKLKQMRAGYKDTTGAPVRLWPTGVYDWKNKGPLCL